jgi:hypothetical protein
MHLFDSLLEPLTPYGWPCVRGLFRFLTTLINNYDKSVPILHDTFAIDDLSLRRNNTEYMMTVGLNLLTVALEVGADHIANYPLLLSIVKDSLCRNLLSVSRTSLRRFSSSEIYCRCSAAIVYNYFLPRFESPFSSSKVYALI